MSRKSKLRKELVEHSMASNGLFMIPAGGKLKKYKGRYCTDQVASVGHCYDPSRSFGKMVGARLDMVLKSGPVKTFKDMTPEERAEMKAQYENK